MSSPYVISQYAVYWLFPTATERLACEVFANEEYKLAYQKDDKSLWMLKKASPTEWLHISPARGSLEIDFGAFPGSTFESIEVTGQLGINTKSVVKAWLMPTDSADHSALEQAIESIRVSAGNVIPGVGFTIYIVDSSEVLNARVHPGLWGKYMIAWEWI